MHARVESLADVTASRHHQPLLVGGDRCERRESVLALPTAVLAAALLQGEQYHLGGLWALTFHRLSEQQYTSTLDVFVVRRHAGRRLGAARLVFHRARPERFAYGLTTETVEGVRVR